MKKLILAALDGTMSEHELASADELDALDSNEYVIFVGSTPYTFHDASDDEIIYRARDVRVLIGVKTSDMAVMQWSAIEPDQVPGGETTSTEVASLAGSLMGMTQEEFNSTVINGDDTELFRAVKSIAASALTQALPRGPVPPADFPRSKAGLPLAVSDLFFNYEKNQFDAVRRNLSEKVDPSDSKDARAALRRDAEEFANSMAAAGTTGIDPDDLVSDFFDRL